MPTYRLVAVTSTRHPLAAAALTLYASHMHPLLRTNTNEIAYWLDRYQAAFPEDRFRVLALCRNDQAVGYCQLTVFADERLGVLDYIVLAPEERNGLAPVMRFIRLLSEYVAKEHPGISIVTEALALSGEKLKQLMTRAGFKPLSIAYAQPPLKAGTLAEPAALYLFAGTHPLPEKAIVRCLYVKHYRRWLDAYPAISRTAQYDAIDKLLKKL